MKPWRQAVRDGLISGSIASVVSTIVMSARGEHEEGTLYAPTNAISHWFFGDHAFYRNERTLRYTGTGYAIHHASSTLWAVVYERWFGERADRRDLATALTCGATVAAIACFTDYYLTPRRLRPGYEQRLSSPSLFLVYAAFGAGLIVRSLTTSRLAHIGSHVTADA